MGPAARAGYRGPVRAHRDIPGCPRAGSTGEQNGVSMSSTSGGSPSRRPLSKVLIANHGEIAVRTARACRDEGLATVAVYADPDRAALHVRLADAAVRLGGARAAATYLHAGRPHGVPRRSGAD